MSITLAAQLSTGHSLPQELTKGKVLPVLQRALNSATLDILIVGWTELPELFHALIDQDKRKVKEVFLWYPMLSDFPDMQNDQLVIDHKGNFSNGWGDFVATGKMNETFRFACPNNPEVMQTSLHHLERLLTTYDFDGVFLDKIRFPSPANGLSDVLSCFCKHCQVAAFDWGLDLMDVKRSLEDHKNQNHYISTQQSFSGAAWMDKLLRNNSILADFIHFRCDSITKMVVEVKNLTNRLEKKLALDVFSPFLAPLVGQDLPVIAKYADWVKPMIYRFAKGPASLRLELPKLMADMTKHLNCSTSKIYQWIKENVPELTDVDLSQISQHGVPLDLISKETSSALDLMPSVPIYLGMETVRIPGVIDITSKNINDIINLGQSVGVSGFALSWDLMHTPIENIEPLKSIQ